MMYGYLILLFIVSLVLCAVGFYKYVYFISIGYGFAVGGIGVTLAVLCLSGSFSAEPQHFILFLLLLIYGARLSGFLLYREIKSTSYKKTFKEVSMDGNTISFPKKLAIWLSVAVLYVAQTSPVFFRIYNEGKSSVVGWCGIAVCIFALLLESVADIQKSAQKKERPDMVAMQGLYRMVRCPNYLGEILFWTGILLSGADIFAGTGQWLFSSIAYFCIVGIMFGGARRLEKRQIRNYGDKKEYQDYADKTPILIPFIPLYHFVK